MRLLLALRCFFLILFARRLPSDALGLLPAPEQALPPDDSAARAAIDRARSDGKRSGALQLLGLLQREGRLIDFLEEEIAGFSDAQVGAAARDIHKGCRSVLAEHTPVKPVLPDADNATVQVEPGFDPARVRLVGNVVGQPPFTGVLKHPGWRCDAVSLPDLAPPLDPSVLSPAEVELP